MYAASSCRTVISHVTLPLPLTMSLIFFVRYNPHLISSRLSAHNLVSAFCAANFLRMTTDVSNFLVKLEAFFNSCILQGCKAHHPCTADYCPAPASAH